MSDDTAVERIFFGLIKLNDKSRQIAKDLIFMIVLGFSVGYLFKTNEEGHQREVTRAYKYIDEMTKEKMELRHEIKDLYEENHSLRTNPYPKLDSIISQQNQLINKKLRNR